VFPAFGDRALRFLDVMCDLRVIVCAGAVRVGVDDGLRESLDLVKKAVAHLFGDIMRFRQRQFRVNFDVQRYVQRVSDPASAHVAHALHARDAGGQVLVEATSNQVNKDGGYTGMRPADFSQFVGAIAKRVGFPRGRVLLGGDHLGPNCWQQLASEQALLRSERLIEDYVTAGFRKIHLDCSMPCADDAAPLDDATVAARVTRLCRVAERTWQRVGGEAPVCVVGTEVPVPGGAHGPLSELHPTSPEAAQARSRPRKVRRARPT